jgi:hypothetical protein
MANWKKPSRPPCPKPATQKFRADPSKTANLLILCVILLFCAPGGLGRVASAQLVPSADGQTVYDGHLKVRWLADFNLAATPEGASIASAAGITTITPGGAMDYHTAVKWVDALNTLELNGAVGYLGHTTWTLPTTPTLPVTDPSCTSYNGSGGGSFGYGCTGSDMGSLYNLKTSLGLQYPNTAVPIPFSLAWPFRNFQPYLYWTSTPVPPPNDGFNTFSFSTGWGGSNVDIHYIYALPFIAGKVQTEHNGVPVIWFPAGVGSLEVSADWQLVYDPVTQVTWSADADLARSQSFGAQCTNFEPAGKPTFFPPGIPCIAPDGSMSNETAENWITGMNAAKWLGQSDWVLPDNNAGCAGFSCQNSELGELFYNQLGLKQGIPVVTSWLNLVGPFYHVQPYLYWSCSAPYTNPPCGNGPAAAGMQYSFSFGSGFEGTDEEINDLYVTAYFPQTPLQALLEAIERDLSVSPQLETFVEQANDIASASTAQAKAAALTAFTNEVNAARGRVLSGPQANELIGLAQLI